MGAAKLHVVEGSGISFETPLRHAACCRASSLSLSLSLSLSPLRALPPHTDHYPTPSGSLKTTAPAMPRLHRGGRGHAWKALVRTLTPQFVSPRFRALHGARRAGRCTALWRHIRPRMWSLLSAGGILCSHDLCVRSGGSVAAPTHHRTQCFPFSPHGDRPPPRYLRARCTAPSTAPSHHRLLSLSSPHPRPSLVPHRPTRHTTQRTRREWSHWSAASPSDDPSIA